MKKDLLRIAALIIACTFLSVQAFAGNGTATQTKQQTKVQTKEKVQSRLKTCR